MLDLSQIMQLLREGAWQKTEAKSSILQKNHGPMLLLGKRYSSQTVIFSLAVIGDFFRNQVNPIAYHQVTQNGKEDGHTRGQKPAGQSP